MNQNTIARQQRGTYSKYGEKLDYSYFDTIALTATGTDYAFFQSPIGQGGKTLVDTNMTLGSQVPQGQKFKVRAIKVAYLSSAIKAAANEQTFYSFLRTSVIRIFITGKDAIYSKPLSEVVGIPIAWCQQDLAAAGAASHASFGRFVGIDVLNVPITLAALTNFEVRLTCTAVGAGSILIGDYVRISLAGILRRAH